MFRLFNRNSTPMPATIRPGIRPVRKPRMRSRLSFIATSSVTFTAAFLDLVLYGHAAEDRGAAQDHALHAGSVGGGLDGFVFVSAEDADQFIDHQPVLRDFE